MDPALIRARLERELAAARAVVQILEDKLHQVEAFEALAQEYGKLPLDGPPGPPPALGELALIPPPSRQPPFQPENPPTADDALVDVAAYVLNKLGGEAHGRELLDAILTYKRVGGDHPMEQLTTVMKRDPKGRFAKVEGRPNTWRLIRQP